MKDNRARWQFLEHPTKPALDADQVRYFRMLMERTLKVGIEFELNLKEQRGSCRGNDLQCPCQHMDQGCWKECLNLDSCKKTPYIETCANRKDKCKPHMCKECAQFSFKCLEYMCIHFVSKCFVCTDFRKDCDNCPKKYDPDKDPANVRRLVSGEFNPTKNYGQVNESGVVEVKKDGSLAGDGGIEVITVGRRVDYWEFFNMSKRILDFVVAKNGYVDERTSTHMHVLNSYYENANANELEKPLPAIVLANFHQLVRRYHNALTWLTIALDDPNHITRWEKFRVGVLSISGVTNTSEGLRSAVMHKAAEVGKPKYAFVNYERTRINGDGNINRFHVEFRESDGTLSPSYYAALACLHYAFVIKAINISRHGVLKVGDEGWLKKAKEMKKVIMNNKGDWGSPRFSETPKVLEHQEYFVNEAVDMLHQMKSILMKVGPAYDVLIKLAEKPIALRRIEGDDWKKIESDLEVPITETDKFDLKMKEVVDLCLVEDCRDQSEWVGAVARLLEEDGEIDDISRERIEGYLEAKSRDGEMIWSDSIGCVVAV